MTAGSAPFEIRILPAVYPKYCAPVRRSPDMPDSFPRHFSLQPSHPTPVTIILRTPIFIPTVHYPLSHPVSARRLTRHDDGVIRLNAISERQHLVEEESDDSRPKLNIPLPNPTDIEVLDLPAQDCIAHCVNGLIYSKVNPDRPTFQEVLFAICNTASASNNPNCHSYHPSG